MSWKESKVRVLTHQGGLQGLQVLSAENKKASDIQDVFLLQPSNASNAVPVHPQTSLPASLPTSSCHPSLAAVKFKIPLPPSSSSPSSILQQQRQHSDGNKSLIIHNLPSDVSCVPIISSNASSRMHQFQIQERPPSLSTLLRHHPLTLSGNLQQQQTNLLEPPRSLHQISNYNGVDNNGIKAEHQNIIELSQTVCNQLPRSTTLTPALCIQQPSLQHQLKEESTATLTLASLLPSSLSIIPTSSSNLNQSSTRLNYPSLQSQQICEIETTEISNGGSTITTELMPPPPPPLGLLSHSRNTTSPSTNVSSTSEERHERDIEFDGNDQVLCRVCGDKASGFHYGVHSCEGCKGFFRRSIQQKIQYRPCTKNQQCNILRINRNRCQYCRLKKCIAAGMSRDAVRFGRVPKREKAKILAAMQSSRQKTQESKILTEMNDDSKIIETIVRAHYDTCDYTRNKIEPFIQKAKSNPSYISCSGTTCPMKGSVTDTFHEQFSERFMDHVRQVCTFAKLIPGFKCLHHDDQVTLLKSCVFEVLLVRLAGLFDSQALICLNGDLIRRDTITHMPPGNAKFLMDSVFGLALRMNQFGLSDAEIGLFCAVVIITPDRPGLRNPDLVHKMQSKLKSVLSNILLPQHPEHATMFSELMTMVHDLRTLNTLHTEKFLQQFKFGGGSSSIDAGVIHTNQDGGSSDEGSQGSNDSSPTNQTVGPKRGWMGNEQDSTGNESPQSYTDTTSTGSVEDGSMNRRSPGMGSVSSSESVRSTEILKLTTNDLKVTGSALLNALSAPTSLSSIAIAAAEVAAKNPSLVASTRSPSSATLCPIMSRRREVDPLCSEFSASKNVDSQKIDQQFLINNLKLLPLQPMSDTGSSSTAVAITIKSNTRTPPAMASSSSLSTLLQSEAGGSKYKTQTRKLDSPSDSGIDSPKGAQGSTHSTNTSLCSSPINDEEKTSNSNLLATSKASEEDRRKEDDNSQRSSSSKSAQHLEEHASMHPLLKRALEQPPQPFNPMMRGVTTFQDEVYKPHKKFRRRNLSSSANIDECPSSTQSTDDRLSSPPPSSPQHHTGSLLASQLAEAPKSYAPRLRSPAQEHPMSLLASTLRRETPLSTPEETKRNELLANLILEGNVPSLCPLDQGLSSEHQGLLMCATSRQEAVFSHQLVNKISNTNTSNLYTTSSLSQDHSITENSTCIPRRQLPPPTATITSQSSKSEPTADYRSIAAASGSYCPYSSDALLEASTRHIPVQQAPTKPHHHHSQSVILGVSSSRSSVPASKDTPPHPEELSKLHSLAEAAASLSAVDTTGANDGNSSTSTGIDSQPLNLSTSRSSPSKQNVPTEA